VSASTRLSSNSRKTSTTFAKPRRNEDRLSIAIDSDHAIWSAFNNDIGRPSFRGLRRAYSTPSIRRGDYEQSERIIHNCWPTPESATSAMNWFRSCRGAEVAADWDDLKSPENYVGYERTENFASPAVQYGQGHVYVSPARFELNDWALSGDWTMEKQAIVLNKASGRIAYRFPPAIFIWSWGRHARNFRTISRAY